MQKLVAATTPSPSTRTHNTHMKLLTTNYITCAVKACKSSPASFPLHFKDAELEQQEVELNAEMIVNILPRIEWPALLQTAAEVLPRPLVPSPLPRRTAMLTRSGSLASPRFRRQNPTRRCWTTRPSGTCTPS